MKKPQTIGKTYQWPADQIHSRPVSSLTPYARNSRVHTPAQVLQIAASVKEWGWTQPIIIDESGGILAGHGRLLAALHLKLEEVPCVIATDWSEAKKRAYVVADNKITENATWDMDMLQAELRDLGDLDFDLSLIGFDGEELDRLMNGEGEGTTEPPPTSTQEIDPDDYQMELRCPKCGFEFDDNRS